MSDISDTEQLKISYFHTKLIFKVHTHRQKITLQWRHNSLIRALFAAPAGTDPTRSV